MIFMINEKVCFTGKASNNIKVMKIHSLLKLPVCSLHQLNRSLESKFAKTSKL